MENIVAEIDRWENGTPILKAQTKETTDPETRAKSVEVIVSSLQMGTKAQT